MPPDPYSQVARVSPTGAPDASQHINVSPNAFGGAVAQGMERLGQGVSTAGAYFGEVAADHAVTQYQERLDGIMHGIPGRMVTGPDGKPTPDMGFMGLKGRAALDARADTDKQLDDLRKEIQGGLPSLQMRHNFDQNSRRLKSYAEGRMGQHADQQANVWYDQVDKASADNWSNHIARNATDPNQVLEGRESLRRVFVQRAERMGGGPEMVKQAVEHADRLAVESQASAIAVTDPAKAMRIIENNKAALGTRYDELSARFRVRGEQQQGREAADRLLGGGSPNENNIGNVRPRGASTGFQQVGSFDEGVALTVNNARAYPASFNGGKDMSLAQIGERWAPKGDGNNDPAQWARNVASGSGLPVDKPINLNDPEVAARFARGVHLAEWGKTKPLDEYRAGVAGKFTPSESKMMPQSDAIDRVLQDPALQDKPQAQAAAIARINQSYALHQKDEVKREVAFKGQVDDTLAAASVTGQPPPNAIPEYDFIRHYGPEKGLTLYADYNERMIASVDRHSLLGMSNLAQQQLLADRREKWPAPGAPGYATAVKRQDAIEKEVTKIQELRRNDPSGAVANTDAVREAIQRVNPKDPSTYRQLVETRLKEQEKVGIEPLYQSPITKAEALHAMTPVQQALPGTKADALEHVAAQFRDMYGEAAPQAFTYALRAMHAQGTAMESAEGVLKDLMSGKPLTQADRRAAKDAEAQDAMRKSLENLNQPPSGPTATEMWMNLPESVPVPIERPPQGKLPVPNNAALRDLRDNKLTAAEFDKTFGSGTSKKLMEEYPFFFNRGR